MKVRWSRGGSHGGSPGKSDKSNNILEDYNDPVGRESLTKTLKDCARIIDAVLIDVALENELRSLSTTDNDNDDNNNGNQSRGGASNSLLLLSLHLTLLHVLHLCFLVVSSTAGLPCIARLHIASRCPSPACLASSPTPPLPSPACLALSINPPPCVAPQNLIVAFIILV
jgi:hypothetical protein